MSAAIRVLVMLAGAGLLYLLWMANAYVAENYWKAAIEDDRDGGEGS